MKERDIEIILHDGTELIYNTEERIIYRKLKQDGIGLLVDAESIADDLIITIDNAQIEQKATLTLYENEVRHSNDLLHDLLKYKKAVKEVVRLYEYGNMETDFEQVLEGMYEVCKSALMEVLE